MSEGSLSPRRAKRNRETTGVTPDLLRGPASILGSGMPGHARHEEEMQRPQLAIILPTSGTQSAPLGRGRRCIADHVGISHGHYDHRISPAMVPLDAMTGAARCTAKARMPPNAGPPSLKSGNVFRKGSLFP